MDIAVLGIDLGETVRSLSGLDAKGEVVFRKRVHRSRLLDFLSDLSPCIVSMEACGGRILSEGFAYRRGMSHV